MNRKVTFVDFKKRSNEMDADFEQVRRRTPHLKGIVSSKLKKYIRNRGCKDDIDKCINIKLTGDPVIIGNGSFGILLKVSTKKQNPVAIKIIFNISKKPGKFIDMEKELAYSYYMGHIGIGPEVLDTFNYNIESNELREYPKLKKIIDTILSTGYKKLSSLNLTNRTVPIEIQCIVMNYYTMDCSTALKDNNVSINDKTIIIKQMVSLIGKQIENGLYCSDIKPGNFVVNFNPIEVKMIDFGSDFCSEDKIYSDYNIKNIIQPYRISEQNLLYISNVIQLYIVFSRFFSQSKISSKDLKKLVGAFFNYRIFDLFFESDWKKLIDIYIDNAYHNSKNMKSDPSNSLLWYAKQVNNIDDIDKVKNFIITSLNNAIKIMNMPVSMSL